MLGVAMLDVTVLSAVVNERYEKKKKTNFYYESPFVLAVGSALC